MFCAVKERLKIWLQAFVPEGFILRSMVKWAPWQGCVEIKRLMDALQAMHPVNLPETWLWYSVMFILVVICLSCVYDHISFLMLSWLMIIEK